jgi:hypothetical protein
VIRLFYIPQPNKDPYHDITVTLSVVEANIAIASASAPALRPLFRSIFPKLFGGSSQRYGASGNKYHPSGYGASSQAPYFSSSHARGGDGTGNASRVDHGHGDRSVARHSSIRLKNLTRSHHGGKGPAGHTECRSISPSGSEEEIMTYNGIMRTTDVRVQVHFEGQEDGHGGMPGREDVEAVDAASSRASSDLKAEATDRGVSGGHAL